MRTESRELLAVGIFGSHSRIGDRIEILLRHGRTFSSRASSTSMAASAVVLGGLMLASSFAPRWIAFAQQEPQQFEVASVKSNRSGDSHWYIRIAPGGKLLAKNATLRSLVLQAYEVQDFQLTGGPAWLTSGRFDIEGRGPGSPVPSQVLQMLQTLLGDRFQLKVRREVRDLPVYALLIGKNGPKLESSRGSNCFDPVADPTAFIAPTTLPCGGFRNASNQMSGAKITMSLFAANLSKYLGRAVVDKTGLDSAYEISLKWTPDETQAFSPPTGPAAVDASEPSIFGAVQEQLGLRLDSQKGPVEVLVIDHAEKPDAN
jgi:uncharacterized protein (TIGR03435 family)